MIALTFTVIDCIKLQNVRLAEAQRLTKQQVGVFKCNHGHLFVFGKEIIAIMHNAVKVIHPACIIYFCCGIFIEIFLLTWKGKDS